MRALLLLLLAAAPARAAEVSTAAYRQLGLAEAYDLALRRSETLAQAGELSVELHAQTRELLGNVLPRVTLNGSQGWSDPPDTSFPIPTSRPYAFVSAHQPLFSGLREFYAIRASKATGEAADLAVERARDLIYQDVAAAYLDLLGIHLEIATRRNQVKFTEDQIRELRSRARIGRSRGSEVLAGETQLASRIADLETALGEERVRQWRLQFLTGLKEDLSPLEVAPPELPEQASFLKRSTERPDVRARRLEVEAADLGIMVQARERWPVISADGNYYFKRPHDFNEHVRWDAQFSASLPLYTGGQITSRVKQARARLRSAQEGLSLALRTADLEVRSSHSALLHSLRSVVALGTAAVASEANAKAQTADYKLGLVTNLDVLTALAAAQDARLSLDRARLAASLFRAQLEVAAGGPR